MRLSSHQTPWGRPAPFWNCLCLDQVCASPSARRRPRTAWSGRQGVHHSDLWAAPSPLRLSAARHLCHTALFLLGDTKSGFRAQVFSFGGFGQTISQTGGPACLWQCTSPPPCRMTGLTPVPQEANAPPGGEPQGSSGSQSPLRGRAAAEKGVPVWQQGGAGLAPPPKS